MTVAVLSAPASMTAEQYHRISEHLDASRTGPPPGRRLHACFGHGDQLMMFDVWDSIEELDAFTATLMPILAVEHIDMAPPEPLEIHDLVDGDAGVLRRIIAELRDKAFFVRPVETPWEKLHSVTGSSGRTRTLKKRPPERDDSPPERRSAAARSHRIARRVLDTHCFLRSRIVLNRRVTTAAGASGSPSAAISRPLGRSALQRATTISIEKGHQEGRPQEAGHRHQDHLRQELDVRQHW